MATIKAFIRSSGKKAVIRLRLSDGRGVTYYGKTLIEINPLWWNPEKEEIKARMLLPGEFSREEINLKVNAAKRQALEYYNANRSAELPGDWITQLLAGRIKRSRHGDDVCTLFEKFIKDRSVSAGRRAHLVTLGNDLKRFSLVNGEVYTPDTFPDVKQFETFLFDEHELQTLHPLIYQGKQTKTEQRSANTVTGKLKILAAFFAYLRQKKLTTADPVPRGSIPAEVYGEPLPLTADELNHLLVFDGLSPVMARVRDMFCLQCFTGCRVGDFMRLTRSNLKDDMLTYIPSKTARQDPKRVYVPLPEQALAIIERFGYPDGYLVPRLSLTGKTGYNKRLKQLLPLCGIDRAVTVLDPLTRQPVMRMMSELMTTHTARRTFINCNYAETQDPALISKMTGHSENSRAFNRYRTIDQDLLRRQIKKVFG